MRGKGKNFTMQFQGAPEEQKAAAPYFKAYANQGICLARQSILGPDGDDGGD